MRPVAKIIPPMKLGPSKRFPLCGAAVVGSEAVVVCGCTVVEFVGVTVDEGLIVDVVVVALVLLGVVEVATVVLSGGRGFLDDGGAVVLGTGFSIMKINSWKLLIQFS